MKNELPNESLWRGKLSTTERAELCAQPDLELEARLTNALTKIPEARVASNFTARVMQVVELEELQTARMRGWHWNWRALLPRAAAAATLLVAAGFTFYQHEIYSQRFELAQNVARVAQAQPLPSVDALQNFDAIQRMSQPARADEGLLALAPDLK